MTVKKKRRRVLVTVSPEMYELVQAVSNEANVATSNLLGEMIEECKPAFEAMLTYTENPAALKSWAHKIGLMLMPVNGAEGKDHQLGVLESLLGMNVGNGAANKQVLSALEDGVVTPAEMDETDRILEDMEHKIQSLRKAMKGECAKYLSALQREKA